MILWNGPNFMKVLHADLVKGMQKAGIYFVSAMRGFLNVSQPYVRTKGGKKYAGLAPSLPGQFPRKLSGQLQKSQTWELDKAKLVLTCGSNLKDYPSYLQTGTRFMKPRPWLTLGFDRTKDKLGKIIVGGK